MDQETKKALDMLDIGVIEWEDRTRCYMASRSPIIRLVSYAKNQCIAMMTRKSSEMVMGDAKEATVVVGLTKSGNKNVLIIKLCDPEEYNSRTIEKNERYGTVAFHCAWLYRQLGFSKGIFFVGTLTEMVKGRVYAAVMDKKTRGEEPDMKGGDDEVQETA